MIKIHETLADGTFLYGWKDESPLTPIAPSSSYHFTEKKIFSEEECESWNEYLLKQENILLDYFNQDAENVSTKDLATSLYPDFNLLNFDFHLIPELKIKIFNGIKTVLSFSDNPAWQATLHTSCWFNVLQKGVGMDVHSHNYHKNSLYGFHVSINAVGTFTSYHHPIKFQEETFHVPNKIGYLTLFPSYLPHGVSLNMHEIPRISIAGDTSYPRPSVDPSLVEIGTCGNQN
jgi:hypothetical protein